MFRGAFARKAYDPVLEPECHLEPLPCIRCCSPLGGRIWRAPIGSGSDRYPTRIHESVAKAPQQIIPLRWTFGGRRCALTGDTRWRVVPRLGLARTVPEGATVVDARYAV